MTEPRHTADSVTDDALDQLYDRLAELEQQLAQARSGEAILGQRVLGWSELAKNHHHWGQRRWNAWKSARARAARAQVALARVTAWCDELDEGVRQLLNAPAAEHPVAAHVRARLADPKEHSTP